MRETVKGSSRVGSAAAGAGGGKAKRAAGRRGRTKWVALGIAAVVLVLAAAGFYVVRGQQAAAASRQLVGGAIANPPQPAPGFTLTDQFGQSRSLGSLAGKPVALTFVYTHCVDVCPVISANLHQAYKQLGSQAAGVGMLAVTVDPEHDDVATVHAYSDKLGLTDEWFFLTGTRPALESVWKAYGVPAQRGATPEEVEHAAPVFLIDKHGKVRAMLPVDVTADVIAQDLGVLLGES